MECLSHSTVNEPHDPLKGTLAPLLWYGFLNLDQETILHEPWHIRHRQCWSLLVPIATLHLAPSMGYINVKQVGAMPLWSPLKIPPSTFVGKGVQKAHIASHIQNEMFKANNIILGISEQCQYDMYSGYSPMYIVFFMLEAITILNIIWWVIRCDLSDTTSLKLVACSDRTHAHSTAQERMPHNTKSLLSW